MKTISIIFSLINLSFHLYGQDQFKSLFNQQETAEILNEVKEYRMDNPEERERLKDIFENINHNTTVVRFHLCGMNNYDLFNGNTDPASNLKYSESYYLLINRAKDTINDFGIYSELFEKPVLNRNDVAFPTKEYDESMYWILNFMETSDWERDKVSIITIIDVPGFFVLYEDRVYVPYRNRMVDFVTYFNQVEFFHYRFGDLLRGKRIYQQWSDSDKD